MQAIVTPSVCCGSVHIPPSKSMSHRAIICASLAHGTSVISNVAYSKDIETTIDGMRSLGAHITKKNHEVIIEGIQNFNQLNKNEIFCNESGSTLRFFIPIFSLCHQPVSFTGAGRLLQRPQKVYEDIFHEHGLYFDQDEHHIQIKQSIPYGEYTLKGDVSSQFISGLLFALPLLEQDSLIRITAPFESRSYVDLTLQMMETYGVHAYFEDPYTLRIPGNQQYKPMNYEIEGDYSQLAFFAVLAAIQHDLRITGVHHDSKQGDKQIISILKSFGTKIENIENGFLIYKSNLAGNKIDLENCPDLGPILTVLGMYSQGDTYIYHAGRLRIKESDRIEAMECELKKFNVSIHSTQDEIFITGITQPSCTSQLYGHNDHRIVMALCVATLCSSSICTIEDAQAISKSYPNFFEDIQSLHGKVELV